jgi:hypothetical protein
MPRRFWNSRGGPRVSHEESHTMCETSLSSSMSDVVSSPRTDIAGSSCSLRGFAPHALPRAQRRRGKMPDVRIFPTGSTAV